MKQKKKEKSPLEKDMAGAARQHGLNLTPAIMTAATVMGSFPAAQRACKPRGRKKNKPAKQKSPLDRIHVSMFYPRGFTEIIPAANDLPLYQAPVQNFHEWYDNVHELMMEVIASRHGIPAINLVESWKPVLKVLERFVINEHLDVCLVETYVLSIKLQKFILGKRMENLWQSAAWWIIIQDRDNFSLQKR